MKPFRFLAASLTTACTLAFGAGATTQERADDPSESPLITESHFSAKTSSDSDLTANRADPGTSGLFISLDPDSIYASSTALSLNSAARLASTAKSSAEDITGSATVTGSLANVPIANVALAINPLNRLLDDAPAPYTLTRAPVSTNTPATSGIATLRLTSALNSMNVQSDVDGLEGPGSASGNSRITSASASLNLSLGGLIGAVNVFTISLQSASAAEVINSYSSVNWDGTDLLPSSNSNVISGKGRITLSVLGVSITIPSLTAGVQTSIGINVNTGVLIASGTITLTADDMHAYTLNNTGYADATSLLANVSLNVRTIAGLTNLNVGSRVVINKTTAEMGTASTVPESHSALMAALFFLHPLLRRHR